MDQKIRSQCSIYAAKSRPLPVDHLADELIERLRVNHAVLQAPTGSGKSTRLPLALMGADWLAGQRMVLLQPRRAAARLLAEYMAEQLGETPGERVGYQVRFERRISPRTRIEVLTEGILTRRLQSDPMLDGIGLIIFDEFHERSLHTDLGLTLAFDIAATLRPDLRLLIMSATLDTDPVAALLGGVPVLHAETRSHPVAIRHARRPLRTDPLDAVCAAVRRVLRDETGNILVFLPGAGEIRRCCERLADCAQAADILPLHASLARAQQDRALRPGNDARRRVILATDIAETSLTIPGIRVVIDSGLARKPHFNPATGLSRLICAPIPLAAADQRAGRAGRLGPGVCERLWTTAEEQSRAAFQPAEILRADLTPLALELTLWGVTDPQMLAWLDPPPPAAWSRAVELLIALGALHPNRTPTPRGHALARLPVHPRLGALLLGATPATRALSADLAALLSEPDPWVAGPNSPRPADLELRLAALSTWRQHSRQAPPGLDPRRLRQIDRAARQLRQLAEHDTGKSDGTTASANGEASSPGALLALAAPDRIAQRRPGTDERYLLANGTGARLPRDDALALHPWLAVAAVAEQNGDHRIQLALPLDEAEIETLFAERIRTTREVAWDARRGAVTARETRRLDALELTSRAVALRADDPTVQILLETLRADLQRYLDWSPKAHQLQARVALLRAIEPDAGWPDLNLQALVAHLEDWLTPWLQGLTRLDEIRRLETFELLRGQLDWTQWQRLEQETPDALTTPAGNRRRIDYPAGATPVLAAPLQELFGLTETPRICSGRVALQLHLLSPAGRPVQITQDLAAFWSNGYTEVRKELRGRYPKHLWPEDPSATLPVTGGLKRRAQTRPT